MAVFEIETPDGTFEVEAPDENTAMQALQGMQGGQEPTAAPEQAQQAEQPYSGMLLPFSRTAEGETQFDPNAGLMGVFKRGATLPGEVYRGEVDPTSEEGIGRAAEMSAVTAPASAVAGTGRALARAAFGKPAKARRGPKPAVPTAQELKQAGSRGFDKLRELGVDYTPQAIREAMTGARVALDKEGLLPNVAPKTHRLLDQLTKETEPGAVMQLSTLHAVRKNLNKIKKNFNDPTEQEAARRVMRELDNFIEAGEGAVAGPAGEAGAVLTTANANYAAGKRTALLDKLLTDAELDAAKANSGANLGNIIRSAAGRILKDEKKSQGFSPEEIQLLDGIVRGSVPANFLRSTGNLLGGGGGLGQLSSVGAGLGTGALMGSPGTGAALAIGLPLTGMAAKRASTGLTKKALGKTRKAVAARSPVYQQRVEGGGGASKVDSGRLPVARALVASIAEKNKDRRIDKNEKKQLELMRALLMQRMEPTL